jgi:hypothetical protein
MAARYRLTIKDAQTTIEAGKIQVKGINFEIPQDQKDRLTEGFEASKFYPVRLTVRINLGQKGYWFATVLQIDNEVAGSLLPTAKPE